MTTIEQIFNMYNPTGSKEAKAVLREILQSIVLIGLSKGDFFSKASFYGGTALRMFYGLNRYSEDLDFTLNYIDENFSIEPYIDKIREVALSYGFGLEITKKEKRVKTPVESAFAKLNTYHTFLELKINDDITNLCHKDEIMKVKFEVDCVPALGFNKEIKWIDTPEFAPVAILDKESLFAGKLHAVLCRNYKNTVKGRDYYDFLFYIQQRINPNYVYLKNKMVQSGILEENSTFDSNILRKMLIEKFESIDFEQVKTDASRFVFNTEDLKYYSKDLFIQISEKLL